MKAPVKPQPKEFGLDELNLKGRTVKDIVLSESLSSVLMVLGTVLAIWALGWWGIGVACFGLGILYVLRRLLNILLHTERDEGRKNYSDAISEYYTELHKYDAYLDSLEQRKKDASASSSNKIP